MAQKMAITELERECGLLARHLVKGPNNQMIVSETWAADNEKSPYFIVGRQRGETTVRSYLHKDDAR